ncbi:unnamed protein product [Coregonus sp. 'balchen']|nr:unnamed protein product [Coregonus sp. 'balchen']
MREEVGGRSASEAGEPTEQEHENQNDRRTDADSFSQGEPRVLGLAMIPGHHVVSIKVESDSLADTQGFGGSH